MPSAFSGRYQSKLFNFFHQQSRRLGEKFERTFRHLQVASSWSLEALLFPLFSLFQEAIDSAGRQLQPKEQQSRLQLKENLTPPASDSVIEYVLKSADKITYNKQQLLVQGIASDLLNRNLVLVSTENEILEILSPQQQAKLQDKIIEEVANYWRFWRLAPEKDEIELLSEIDRLLNKMSGDNQENILELPPENFQEKHEGIFAFLDSAIALVESHAIQPATEATLTVQKRSSQVIQLVQTQLNILIYGKQQIDADKSDIQISVLISQALNYFFGTGNKKQLSVSNSPKPFIKKPQLLTQDFADVWLSPGDLFGEPETDIAKSLPTSSENLVNNYQNFLQPGKLGSGLAKKGKTTRNLSAKPKKSGKISAEKTTKASIARSGIDSNTQIEAKPDWIETQATSVGYEKHPLEQILEWVDRLLLKLEELFVRIFKSLQQLWLGK
ncbi:MAG: hypothetical protein KME60_04905 [Cyanomargarita calcarea GSE-NOS-MK-12-04C]|jgi:hypothetical protein|uniref:Uncharacterized protein n=1 Tax=Cyanomargarita calcarea GSE-NOS-MK-12-04C TaxID=2839659 RepID=A0A951QIQ1_9CYAN|nr:hypothetical protein [Cyanomargarita calcarea GSE-NOS-MK-12-04C]